MCFKALFVDVYLILFFKTGYCRLAGLEEKILLSGFDVMFCVACDLVRKWVENKPVMIISVGFSGWGSCSYNDES